MFHSKKEEKKRTKEQKKKKRKWKKETNRKRSETKDNREEKSSWRGNQLIIKSKVKNNKIRMNQFVHFCFNLFLVFSFQSIFLGEEEIGFALISKPARFTERSKSIEIKLYSVMKIFIEIRCCNCYLKFKGNSKVERMIKQQTPCIGDDQKIVKVFLFIIWVWNK